MAAVSASCTRVDLARGRAALDVWHVVGDVLPYRGSDVEVLAVFMETSLFEVAAQKKCLESRLGQARTRLDMHVKWSKLVRLADKRAVVI